MQSFDPNPQTSILAAMEDDEFGEITVRFEPQCFVAGTPVATEAGLKPIEEIKPHDKVWAWNEATDEVTLRPVVTRFIYRRSEVFVINVGRDAFKVTGEHPFYLAGKGRTPARDLRSGDQLVASEDYTLEVNATEKQVGEVLVYNFEVSTDHNYYVGEEGILTHNANPLRLAMGLTDPYLPHTTSSPSVQKEREQRRRCFLRLALALSIFTIFAMVLHFQETFELNTRSMRIRSCIRSCIPENTMTSLNDDWQLLLRIRGSKCYSNQHMNFCWEHFRISRNCLHEGLRN